MFKKFTAAVLGAVLAIGAFTGCSKNYESVLTIDGVAITPGEYLYAQYQAYNSALSEVEDEENVLSATIEDMPAEQWIHEKAIQSLKSHIWAEKTAEEMGIQLTQEEIDNANMQAEYYWPYYEEIYADNGIGLETYKKFVISSIKLDRIFAKLYTDGGEKEPSDDEYNKYIDENYARVVGFNMTKQDNEGNFLTQDQLEQIQNLCQEAVDKLNAGEDYETIRIEYMNKAAEIAGLDLDYSDPTIYSKRLLVSNATTTDTYDQMFVANALVSEINGDYLYDEREDDYIVYHRVDAYSSEDEFDSLKDSVIGNMKADEFTQYIEDMTKDYQVSEDSSAVKYYSLSKIK